MSVARPISNHKIVGFRRAAESALNRQSAGRSHDRAVLFVLWNGSASR